MGKNIFENAKFGDVFKTRDSRNATVINVGKEVISICIEGNYWGRPYDYAIKDNGKYTFYTNEYDGIDIVSKENKDDSYESGFNNGFESAVREVLNNADIWLRTHLPRVLEKYYPETTNDIPDADVLNEDMREDFKQAMVKKLNKE